MDLEQAVTKAYTSKLEKLFKAGAVIFFAAINTSKVNTGAAATSIE